MKKYDIMLYPHRHESKKAAQKYVGAIKTRVLNYPKKLTIREIAEAATSGYTMILGLGKYSDDEVKLMEKSKKRIGAGTNHWIKQQVYAIDFDNEIKVGKETVKLTGDSYFTVETAIARCVAGDILPAFAYYTDSHKDDHNKFRLVFVLDKAATTLEQHRDIINSLFNMFLIDGKCIVDVKCSDPCRLFYSGKKLAHENYAAVVKSDKLIKQFNGLADIVKRLGKPKKCLAIKRDNPQLVASEMIDLIRQNRIEELRRKIVVSLSNPQSLENTGLEPCGLSREQVSYILLTPDTCSPNSRSPSKPVVMRHPSDYYDTTRKFPLHLLLGVTFMASMKCILPEHEDSNPSARIEQRETGEYVYHCYGCDSRLDIFDMIERLTGCNHTKAKTFLNQLFNIRFETEWQIRKKLEITEYQDYACTSNQLSLSHPFLHKRLERSGALKALNLVLQLARYYIYDRKVSENENPLFYMSLSLMAQKSKEIAAYMPKTTLHKRIKFLTRLGLIEMVKEKDLPDKFRDELKKRKEAHEQHYRINCFVIPSFTMALLDDAEKKLRTAEESGMRRGYYCREAELRANGLAAAKDYYVQDGNKSHSVRVDEFYRKYKQAATKLLKKGWTNEKEILMAMRGYSKTRKQELSGICLPQLLKELFLKRVPYAKFHAEQFGVPPKTMSFGVSKIIVFG